MIGNKRLLNWVPNESAAQSSTGSDFAQGFISFLYLVKVSLALSPLYIDFNITYKLVALFLEHIQGFK